MQAGGTFGVTISNRQTKNSQLFPYLHKTTCVFFHHRVVHHCSSLYIHACEMFSRCELLNFDPVSLHTGFSNLG